MYQQDSRTTIQSALQQELQTRSFQRRFNRFRKSHKQFRQFSTPQDLVEFFHSPNPELNLKDRLLWRLIKTYQSKPKHQPWLLTLLLVISQKQMAYTFYRFGYNQLNLVNPYDSFAPVYGAYIDSFLEVPLKRTLAWAEDLADRPNPSRKRGMKKIKHTPPYSKFALRIKDHAEYLIRKEIKECHRVTREAEHDIPAPENLPGQFEIEQMIEEWTTAGILNQRQSELVIYRLVYEYTFKELEKKFKTSATALRQEIHRLIKRLKPYLATKYFKGD